MLLTNTSVATKIEETFPQSAVLRRHPLTILRYPAKAEGSIVKRFEPGHLGYVIGQVSRMLDPEEPRFPHGSAHHGKCGACRRPSISAQAVLGETFDHYGLASPIVHILSDYTLLSLTPDCRQLHSTP